MKTLFDGKTYVIGHIKKKEIKEVLNIAKENNLTIRYPWMFDNPEGDLHRIAIDDHAFGGFVSVIICYHEFTVKKSPKWGWFNNVKELKQYIKNKKTENK